MRNLYTENYNTFIKDTEKDTNKWKDTPGSWIEKINIVKTKKLRGNKIKVKVGLYDVQCIKIVKNHYFIKENLYYV